MRHERFARTTTKLAGGIAMATAVTLLLGATPHAADKNENVENLGVCYALGTDAIGYAVNKTTNANHDTPDDGSDPNFTAGLELYRGCFTDDFEFNIELSSGAFIPWAALINNASGGDDRALQWANFVNNTFRNSNYESTQHQLGSIYSEVSGNTAYLQSYLTATHARATGGLSIAYGTYKNDVVKVKGQWRIKSRTLLLRQGISLP
jgi:hypothetical protein